MTHVILNMKVKIGLPPEKDQILHFKQKQSNDKTMSSWVKTLVPFCSLPNTSRDVCMFIRPQQMVFPAPCGSVGQQEFETAVCHWQHKSAVCLKVYPKIQWLSYVIVIVVIIIIIIIIIHNMYVYIYIYIQKNTSHGIFHSQSGAPQNTNG